MYYQNPRISNIDKLQPTYFDPRESDFSQFSVLNSAQKPAISTHSFPSFEKSNMYFERGLGFNKMDSKIPLRTNPYFTQVEDKQKQGIFCVICNKTYSNAELETHLLMHKKPKMSLSSSKPLLDNLTKVSTSALKTPIKSPIKYQYPIASIPKSQLKSTLKAELPPPPLKTRQQHYSKIPKPQTFVPILPTQITKVTKTKNHRYEVIPQLQTSIISNPYTIAPTIPKSERTTVPKQTNIFKPSHLSLGLTPEIEPTYQQMYLNPEKYSLTHTNDYNYSINDLLSVHSMKTTSTQKISLKNKNHAEKSFNKRSHTYFDSQTQCGSKRHTKQTYIKQRQRQQKQKQRDLWRNREHTHYAYRS